MHTWGQEEQMRTEKGILGIRRALNTQIAGKGTCGKAYGDVEKGTLLVEEGTSGLKRIGLHISTENN